MIKLFLAELKRFHSLCIERGIKEATGCILLEPWETEGRANLLLYMCDDCCKEFKESYLNEFCGEFRYNDLFLSGGSEDLKDWKDWFYQKYFPRAEEGYEYYRKNLCCRCSETDKTKGPIPEEIEEHRKRLDRSIQEMQEKRELKIRDKAT